MTQKILAGRADDPNLSGDLVRVKVDQIITARDPRWVVHRAAEAGLKKTSVEVAIAYDTHCITERLSGGRGPEPSLSASALKYGVLIARPGIGFPAAVHLERFGSPARLAITDEPRLASVGGAGMLTLIVSPAHLADALLTGAVWVRPARSVQVLLSGRTRPFVCVRDVALELLRRGLGDIVRRIDTEHEAPVVVEFSGPSARLLSVPDRAVLCALAPQLGAAGAIFVSDEKTEVYLRDQRRSKAHRSLVPDPGAPCDDVLSVDLSAVDPLVMDDEGNVRPVRELAGKPVRQVILGGDSGASLRDLLAAASLLKSKRVPPKLDFLVAPPSRQALEVLAQSGALVDLIATGARLLEPDQRIVTGELYPPAPGGASLRTFDPEPSTAGDVPAIVASGETLAYAVASGEIGDPRSFKRPVRVTTPRSLPTDDVLIVRKGKGKKGEDDSKALSAVPKPDDWGKPSTLTLIEGRTIPDAPSALLLGSLDDVRWATRKVLSDVATIRAVIAPYIPSGTASALAGLGVLALTGDETTLKQLSGKSTVSVPAASAWRNAPTITLTADKADVTLVWHAKDQEREWATVGGATKAAAARAPAAKTATKSTVR